MKKYRKTISPLNAAINTTERLMCAKRYDEIDFHLQVPSRCLNTVSYTHLRAHET